MDKLCRAYNAATAAGRVLAISHSSGITKLTVDAAILSSPGSAWLRVLLGPFAPALRRHCPGQFAFIHLPAVDALEWHPFTISSPPAVAAETDPTRLDGVITFHVRDMGPGTWTGRLAALAATHAIESVSSAATTSLPLIAIDGPYGNQGRFYEHTRAIFLAGGIGVTPFVSILRALLSDARARAASGKPPAFPLRRIHFIWVVRFRSICEQFGDFMGELLDDGGSQQPQAGIVSPLSVSVQIYVTRERGAAEELAPLLSEGSPTPRAVDESMSSPQQLPRCQWQPAIAAGRPDLPALFAHVASDSEGEPEELPPDTVCLGCCRWWPEPEQVAVLACGPQPMTAEAADLSARHGFAFHVEHFLF